MKTQKGAGDVSELVLPSLDGSPFITFPLNVIHPMRRMISLLDRNKEIPPRLAFAAALRGEGVSYISWAFATTMAYDLETSVCVVDLNWWWPSAIYLKGTSSPGLGAVLVGDVTLDRALVQTGKPNLAYLPSGSLPPHEWAYFARSAILHDTILELGSHYDHLVLDIPAILASNDTIPLASLANAFCLVIHQGVTSVEEAKLAMNDLSHVQSLCVVMNKFNFPIPKPVLKFIKPHIHQA